MYILVTAFGPFDGFVNNPSEAVLNVLKARQLESKYGLQVHFEVLPVSFSAIDDFQDGLLDVYDLIIHLGVATGESVLRFEVLGQNAKTGTDVDGQTFSGERIIDSKVSIPTSFPDRLISEMTAAHPDQTRISTDAGTYLCNYIYYKSLNRYSDRIPVLFVHVADTDNRSQAPTITRQAELVEELIVRYQQRFKADEEIS